MDEVRVMYVGDKPTSMRKQPPLEPDEKSVLRKKISKFISKGYISPSALKINSLIKYFAMPKGIIGGVVQDWRIVFHAGANKHNNSVWALSFALPSINSLLRIVDSTTLMLDWDMGEMFLNFQLHPDMVHSTPINLGPLEFFPEEARQWWMCWQRCLMGFKASTYNSI